MASITVTVKSPFQSKTVWLNAITLIITFGSLLLQLPEVAVLIPDEWWRYITAINAVLNLILRFLTSQPIVNPPPTGPMAE